ncbi:MAG TPA: FAD:protein FMN transferase [Oscillatoriaceae cyanobacterium]
MLHERRFRAMNTDIGVWLESEDAEAARALETASIFFEAVEQDLSRFRQNSALSRLNAAAGQGPQAVSPILRDVATLALKQSEATDGVFDPTVFTALHRAGYVGSFETIGRARGAATLAPRAAWREIRIDNSTIDLPAGTGLDLGGIAKGWTVDRLAEKLRAFGPVLVDAGGDMRTFGKRDDEPWAVALADPFRDGEEVALFALCDEAIATSSVGKRRWQQDGRWHHHLIDPRTQQPSTSDLHTVTVIGPSAVASEVASKVALILGREAGTQFLAERGYSAVLIDHDGELSLVGQRLVAQ